MANKIKKMMNNGTAYKVGGIESSNDTYENIIHLTQAEYDALETKDPDTLYSTPDNATDPSIFIVGEIKIFSGETIPENFLECDGSALSTTAYPELFAVIGYTYGGSELTFNLPNLKGRVVTGYDSSDSCFNCAGKCGGEKTHTLTINEMPSHCHNIRGTFNMSGSDCVARACSGFKAQCKMKPTDNTGGGCAHNNLQPYITLKYIIRYK